MRYDVIMIDANNLYEKNYATHRKLTFKTENGTQIITGGIYGFLRSLKKIERDFLASDGVMYIVFDNAHSQDRIRKEIDPEYKSNRKKRESAFYRNLEILQYLLLHYRDNYFLVYRSKYEADDLVKPIVQSLSSDKHILLVSEDQDWARLIDFENRVVHWYAKNQVFDSEAYEKEYLYPPTESNIILWKTFRGDHSDHIPVGVANIKSTTLFQLMKDYNDIYDILQDVDIIEYLSETVKEKIVENKARLRLNDQLVSFTPLAENQIQEYIYRCTWDKKSLQIIYESLGFNVPEIDSRYKETSADPEDIFKTDKLPR